MKPFTANVIDILKQIPVGKVMTYGQVAKFAGSPRGARQVVRILHSMSRKYDLPWHRVVNIKGQIALKSDEGVWTQKNLLEDEGIDVSEDGRVDLENYQYQAESFIDEL
ncbi:MGMT family protein [Virgibacillus necropolis]|uniref:MGMT family protein n=1 Tax=Virgibacillus necropolis TaxID=163877 RepID=UPI00384B5889